MLDASPLSEVTLEPSAHLITALAAPAQARLHLQRVLDLPSFEGRWHNRVHLHDAWQDAESSLKRTAESLRQCQGPLACKLTITTSVTANTSMMETIMQQTAQPAQIEMTGQPEMDRFDLISLPTHQRRGLRHLISGNMPERVLCSTHLPLLVVHAPEATTTPSHTKAKRNPGMGEN